MSYLVDANVLCEATRPQPQAKVLTWLERHDAELHVSTLTLAEIVNGIHLLSDGKKRRKLVAWFTRHRNDHWSSPSAENNSRSDREG